MSDTALTSKLTPVTSSAAEGQTADIWRDTPLRYMGYANEVGEAFRPLFPKLVRPSYGVAFAYVFGVRGCVLCV